MPRLSEVAARLEADLVGDGDIVVTGINHPTAASPDQLALAMEKSALAALSQSRARTAVIVRGQQGPSNLAGVLYISRPRYALAALTGLFAPPLHTTTGIHSTAVIDPAAKIEAPASIGPFTVIGPGAWIGPRTRILAHVTVGAGARIGADGLLYPGVCVGERVEIGDRVILHHNVSLGSDGFSFAMPEADVPSPPSVPPVARIASLGTVILGDDVEVGANSCIDRATIEATIVGHGTKIDNLVMIGHNTHIGQGCMIAALVGISGSCRIGNRVVLAGAVGVADHVTIGDGVVVLAGSGVNRKHVAPGEVLFGYPAVPRAEFVAQMRQLGRLPKLLEEVKALRASLGRRGADENADEN